MRHGGVSDMGMRQWAVVEPSRSTPSELAVPTAGWQSPPGEFRWAMRHEGAGDTGMRPGAVVEPCRRTSSVLAVPTAVWQSPPGSGRAGGNYG